MHLSLSKCISPCYCNPTREAVASTFFNPSWSKHCWDVEIKQSKAAVFSPSCNLCTSWAKDLLVHADSGEDTILLGVLWETIQEFADVIFRVHPNTLGAADPTEHTTALAFGQKSHWVLRIAFLLLDVHLQCGAMNKVEMLQLGFALPVPSLNNLRSCHCIRKGVVGDQIVELLALFCFHLVHERANP